MRWGDRNRLTSPVLWAFVLGLLIRAALPAGVMIDAQAPGGPTITLCSGHGPVEVVLDANGGYRPVHHAPAGRHHEGECPFAGGHVFTPPTEVAEQAAHAVAWPTATPPTPRERSPALGLRAPPPPSHAPPVFLS
jgi:hypothetical protein